MKSYSIIKRRDLFKDDVSGASCRCKVTIVNQLDFERMKKKLSEMELFQQSAFAAHASFDLMTFQD